MAKESGRKAWFLTTSLGSHCIVSEFQSSALLLLGAVSANARPCKNAALPLVVPVPTNARTTIGAPLGGALANVMVPLLALEIVQSVVGR
jgi:hypothetical protein